MADEKSGISFFKNSNNLQIILNEISYDDRHVCVKWTSKWLKNILKCWDKQYSLHFGFLFYLEYQRIICSTKYCGWTLSLIYWSGLVKGFLIEIIFWGLK